MVVYPVVDGCRFLEIDFSTLDGSDKFFNIASKMLNCLIYW